MNNSRRVLGVFALAMINVAAIVSLRNLSIMVEYGFASVFFYTVAAITFFIPTALVCAELATGWPKEGGLYYWVSLAFGKKMGFFAIWTSWMLSIAWFPAVLTFSAAMIAYIINPDLSNNRYFMFGTMMCIFWGSTFVNFLGIKTSSAISTFCVLIGTLLPGALVISMGVYWLYLGLPLQIEINKAALLPEFRFSQLVFFAGVVVGLAGMEMSAFHAINARNPQKDYPRSILMATIIILIISVLGSLSIAFVVPQQEIHLTAGLMQAFQAFLNQFKLGWCLPMLAFFAAIGSLAGINTWIIGPARGIFAASADGFVPNWMHKVNANNMPVATLIVQATLGSMLASVFFFMPDVNTAYWIITALTVQFGMVMYILIFASGIRLRLTQPDALRPYKIPFGNVGMYLVAGIGIMTSVGTFAIAFVPPEQLQTGSPIVYVGYLLCGLLMLSIPPYLLAQRRG